MTFTSTAIIRFNTVIAPIAINEKKYIHAQGTWLWIGSITCSQLESVKTWTRVIKEIPRSPHLSGSISLKTIEPNTAVFGSIVFSEIDPDRWGDLGISLITLVQVLTLSSWEQVMLPIQSHVPWAWIYFFSFIAIGAITVLNLIIAVLVNVMTEINLDKDNKG